MRWLAMFLLAVVLFAGCYWLDGRLRPALATGDAETAIEFERQHVAPRIFATGLIAGKREEIDLKFELPGRLRRVFVAAGSRVQAGQVVAELEPNLWEVQLAGAQARLALARAQRELILTGRHEGGGGWRPVPAAGGVPAAAMRPLVSQEELKVADAQIQIATAAVNYQQLMVSRTRLLAPCDGILLHVESSVGDMVGPGDPPERLILAPDSATIIRAYVEELDALDVQPGQRAVITLPARRNRQFEGLVEKCAPELHPKRIRHFQPGERLDVSVREVTIKCDALEGLPHGTPVEVMIDHRPRP